MKSSSSERNKRVVPLNNTVDEETEANLLRFIINFYQYPVKRTEVLDRFNANIPYSGLNYSVSQDVSVNNIPYTEFLLTTCKNFYFFRHFSLKTRNVSYRLPYKLYRLRMSIQMLRSLQTLSWKPVFMFCDDYWLVKLVSLHSPI